MATKHRRPLQRTMLIGGGLFVIVLCIALSIQGAITFNRAMFNRYNVWLTRILTYVDHSVDADELRDCLQKEKKSATYKAFQTRLNGMVDDFELTYLYIVYPDMDEGVLVNVISATSAEEFAAGYDNMEIKELSDAYDPEVLRKYDDAMKADGLSFFFESSDWGDYYTACKPLVTTDGETIAVICADIPTEFVRKSVNTYLAWNVGLIVLVGALFSTLMILWVRRNVTGPVQMLERSARGFAEKSHKRIDPGALTFDKPEIHTGNELESLSGAIAKMADDMRSYVEGILSAEQRATTAEKEAYQDALTHVRSKTAFLNKMTELNEQIQAGEGKFALVMTDLDDLKGINDNYGHEHGDDYIIGACGIVAHTYKHSPVYRVGGDEFVAVLQGEDYDNRDALLQEIQALFRQAREKQEAQPWERYSASVGMALYSGTEGQTAEDVLAVADEDMYRRKRQIKGENVSQEE